jgi:hypothetical protein
MKYMLLLYVPADIGEHEAARASMEAWNAYTNELQESGSLVAVDALQGLATATTVRERDGDRLVTDGPYAETKEMLGGYYLIDVPDLDAALGWAAKVPNAPYGSVEVRPIMEFDAP